MARMPIEQIPRLKIRFGTTTQAAHSSIFWTRCDNRGSKSRIEQTTIRGGFPRLVATAAEDRLSCSQGGLSRLWRRGGRAAMSPKPRSSRRFCLHPLPPGANGRD